MTAAKIVTVALVTTFIVIIVYYIPRSPNVPVQTQTQYQLPNDSSQQKQISQWPLWDRKSIASGPSPWKEACQYKDINFNGLSYSMCIRSYDDIVSSSIRSGGRWADCDPLITLWETKAASKNVQDADPEGIFVDAGANIGSCSMLMAAAGKRTFGFEPSRANSFYLTASAMSNPPALREKLSLYLMGLGETYTRASVFVAKGNAGNAQLHSTSSVAVADWANQKFDEEDVIVVGPLDDILWPDKTKPAPHIRVMKMDVQGYEVKILKGAKQLLAAGAIGILKTELTPHFLQGQGSSPQELLQIMASNGYGHLEGSTVKDIDPQGNYPGEVVFQRKQQ